MGTFIVIETFDTPSIVTDEDGEVKYFDTYEAAQAEADECQSGQVVKI